MTVWDNLMQNFKKDGTNRWPKGRIISSIVIFIALLLFAVYKSRDLKERAADRAAHIKYTIGTTGDKRHNFTSSQSTVEYTYKVGQQEFSEIQHVAAQFEKSVMANGGRYYVEFSSINPSNSKLLLDYPVPDSITYASSEGWTYMPGYSEKR